MRSGTLAEAISGVDALTYRLSGPDLLRQFAKHGGSNAVDFLKCLVEFSAFHVAHGRGNVANRNTCEFEQVRSDFKFCHRLRVTKRRSGEVFELERESTDT